MTITSRSNPLITEVCSYKNKKNRDEDGVFVFEGIKLFYEALKNGVEIRHIFATEKMLSRCSALADKERIITVSDSVYEKMSQEKSPEGVICVAKRIDKIHNINKIYNIEEISSSNERKLLLSSLRDPGNLGTVIRTCRAFGCGEIIMSCDCADIYNSKTVRASMGTLFSQKISIVQDLAQTVKDMKAGGYNVCAAVLDSTSCALNEMKIDSKTAFIVGNEGHGIAPDVIEAASGKVYIPMADGVESLNAAVAATVFMWQSMLSEK